ncbi:PBSX family phage terminase large subunit [Bacillus infantis]|uniref:PBSX family phage terminase large subunit n=1 Tax=Bacillus infantis TaxID=324767 RepID=UPI00101C0206|nr:PBSX family phage terminase large subunit [Bacillus infantis]RYI25188.1 PBSX family phage terminase large subunit [Bacillus infantis]
MTATEITINPHFEDFIYDWNQKFYFLVGGYGSSKSYNTALKLIIKLLNEKRTCLVIRNVFDTHRDSTFSLFKEIAYKLGLYDQFNFKTSPLEVHFPNGSKIIFRGCDDPEKLKSINDVSIIWVEECSEIPEQAFMQLMGRLRHPSLSLHMILSTNPVSKNNWCYRYFFNDDLNDRFILDDEELYEKRILVKDGFYYHHSTVDDNKFVQQSYIDNLDDLKNFNPDEYRIAREGKFGVSGIRVFPQFETMPADEIKKAIQEITNPSRKCGMDFGFAESYNALYRMVIDNNENILYIHFEYYTKGLTDPEIADDLREHGFDFSKELIKADSAEPKTIAYFRQQGFNIRKAKKYKGSRLQYTKKVKRFRKIIVSDACPNAIRELQYLTFKKDKQGKVKEDEFSIDPHSLSAIWYALDDYEPKGFKGDKITNVKETFGIW